MKTEIISKTIKHGVQTYIYKNSKWYVYAFGSHLENPSKGLHWRWIVIDKNNVPKEVLNLI